MEERHKVKAVSHHVLNSLSESALLLNHLCQFSAHCSCQLYVQALRVCCHLTQQLLMGKHTVTLQPPVVRHTLTAHGQLHSTQTGNIKQKYLCQSLPVCTPRNGCQQFYPVCSAKVNSFSKVVALVEAAVIGSREGHHKLSSTLIGPIDLLERNICKVYIYIIQIHNKSLNLSSGRVE